MGMTEVMGLVRHVLTFGGGYLVGHGFTTQSDMETGVAAVMTLVGIVWSYHNKQTHKQEVQAALATPASKAK